MERKPSKEFLNSEALFKSTNKELTNEFMEFWETAFDQFSQLFRDVEMDGTQDALRCRMIASIRLAQFGLSMFNFFSSAAVCIKDGNADAEACNATAKVVSMMIEGKVDGWITKAKGSLN